MRDKLITNTGAAMKCVALIAALIGLPLPAASADECMDKATAQTEINECARKARQASDDELNKLYRQIEQRLNSAADTKQRLISAQRAWTVFRDKECAFASSGVQGGSAAPMIHDMCLDDLTQKRNKELKSYLACGDKEGDLSCPVPAARR